MNIIRRNAGFTLIELLIALALLTLLAISIGINFSGNRSRAQSLISTMTSLAEANQRLKNDTGCYIRNPRALFDPATANIPGNNHCARTFGSTWNGPYVTRFNTDADGNARVDKVSSEAVVSFMREDGGMGKRYFLRATNIPNDILREALNECNATVDETVTFENNKCRATLGTGTDEVGSFDMLYDETR